MAGFRITLCGNFSYNAGWQFYVKLSLAVLRLTQVAVLHTTQDGIFTYNTW
jgi:low affinity Fe/Cu permease